MASYEIVIRNETSGEGEGVAKNLAGQTKETKEEKSLSKINNQAKAALSYVATNTVRELVVSKVGEVTRNNLLQRKIDTAMRLGQTVLAFTINPILGVATTATSLISQTIDYNLSLEKQRNRTQINWERAGWINRSRD